MAQRQLLPLLQELKSVYLLWLAAYRIIPKTHRHSLGQRIDTLFIELIELTAAASFTTRSEKIPFVRLAIQKLDTIKILLMVLWETKLLDNKKYLTLAQPTDDIGKMLGGWHGQLAKQNSPINKMGEK